MSKIRLISRIDIKNEHVIKGIQFDGLRKLGEPNKFAKNYYNSGIDEILFMDAVASLYDRNNLYHIINQACKEIFIPITVGGGIRKIEDITQALEAGADKVSVNTQAIKDPNFISAAAKMFGKQCIVGSIEAKKKSDHWEAYIDGGREPTGKNVIDWARELQNLGAGEILLTSVDKDGTRAGLDIELINKVSSTLTIPLVVSGGIGNVDHVDEVCKKCNFDGLAIASILHYNISDINSIKEIMLNNNLRVRR